ncbi:MAG: hypothetical protein IIZ39_15010 [Blautia sp.]|nr:hypothetical protein [Blautia sp.]
MCKGLQMYVDEREMIASLRTGKKYGVSKEKLVGDFLQDYEDLDEKAAKDFVEKYWDSEEVNGKKR